MRSRRAQRLIVALGLIVGLLLDGCTSSSPHKKLGKCQVTCMGRIDGAEYSIKMPQKWNHTLLLYSHGYQFAGTEPHPSLSPLDTTGAGDDDLSAALLDKGYALAGSASRSTGWAVRDGVDTGNRLYERFTTVIRKPQRVYVWGSSLGGLVTELLAEHSDWVDGAAPLCGVVGGPLLNFDNWLETLVATQALLGAQFTYTGSPSPDAIKAERAAVNVTIRDATRDRDGGGAAKLLYLEHLLGLPSKSSLFVHDDSHSEIDAAAQNLAGYISLALQFLAAAREQFGGNPARTHPAADAPPLTSAQLARITSLHGNVASFAAQVDAATPPLTSTSARSELAANGDPTGALRVPTLTLHGIDDPLAIAANETVLRARVAAHGGTDRLVQLFVGPYEGTPGAGVGHCAFTIDQQIAVVDTLDLWVRQGSRPSAVGTNFPAGLDPNYDSPRWPSGALR